MAVHAKLSASSAHRWLACLGSIDAEKGLKDKSSPNAEEGTAAHELAELALKEDKAANTFIGQTLPESKWLVDGEMADYVQAYVDYVTAIGGEQFYEERVNFSEWVVEGFGTSDVIAIDGDTLHIIDLKYGKGVRVDAENNPQGMLYALGSYSEFGMLYNFKRVRIHIVQPRLDHISEWEITIEDLLKWGAWVSEQVQRIEEGGAPRTAGEKQCQWCKAKATCPALKKYTENIIMSGFDELDTPNPDTLNDDQLRAALESKKLIESWLTAVETLVNERLLNGGKFEGFKLVEGRSLRKWGDEPMAVNTLEGLLGDEAYERKLLTPAKAEKALGKSKAKDIQNLIIKPEGKPTLVPESDKRQSIQISVDDFE